MKTILLAAATLLLFSCGSTKQLPKTVSSEKDSTTTTTTEIRYRDTTLFLPGEKIIVKDYTICDSLNRAQLPKKTVKAGRLTATIEIKDGKTSVDCHEDSLIAIIAQISEEYQKSETRIHDLEVQQLPPVNYLEWWQKALCWIGAGALAFGLFKLGRLFV